MTVHYSKSMNQNLIPERRTDKNGVTSTRWVKPAQGVSDKLSGIPAPAGVKVRERPSSELLESAADLYVQEIEEDMADDEDYMADALEAAMDAFSVYPASVVAEIAKETENGFIKHWGLKQLIHSPETSDDVDLILDYLKLSDTLAEADYDDPMDAVRMVVTLSKGYHGVAPVPLNGEYPELRLRQLKALLMGFNWVETHTIDGHISEDSLREVSFSGYSELQVIADERLSNLLIERLDQNELIVDFIKDRRNTDVDAMLEVLDTDTPALSRGIL